MDRTGALRAHFWIQYASVQFGPVRSSSVHFRLLPRALRCGARCSVHRGARGLHSGLHVLLLMLLRMLLLSLLLSLLFMLLLIYPCRVHIICVYLFFFSF